MRAALLLLAALAASAQPPAPHAGYVYPAGGRQGETVEVTLGGQNLINSNNAYLTGGGVNVSVVEYRRPMTPMQANALREEMQALNKKRTEKPGSLTAGERARFAEIRAQLLKFVPRPANPSIAERVTLRVEIAPNAAPGERELRVATPAGTTNPVVFVVGTLPETARPIAEPWSAPGAVVRPAAQRALTLSTTPTAPVDLTLPVVANGQIMPGAVDRYRFQAAKGRHIVIEAAVRQLIPYISDAVPGWFQAALALRDSAGREIARADHYRFHPDPVMECDIPADGTYTVEIHDSIYRGREDFVYRLTVGEVPFVTSIYPLGARSGAKSAVQVSGWNLPVTRLNPATKGTSGIELVSVPGSNALPFAVDDLPEAMEKEGNNQRRSAQKVKMPVIVNGRIDRPGATDWFRFDGRAGEEIVADVMARRLDSPVDSVLRLFDKSGRQLAINDDFDDQGSPLQTHHADSHIDFKLPAGGAYYVEIADAQHQGGPEYGYRLRISRPRPDYELRVTPASLTARSGGAVPVSVYAIRRDGFAGEIALKLKDAPEGFGIAGGMIPAGQSSVRVTLSAPVGRLESPHRVAIEGRAMVQGREVRRTAVAAEDMMQAFYYHHIVPAGDLLVRVLGTQPPVPWKPFPEKTAVRLAAGGETQIQVPVPARRLIEQVQFSLNDPPEGITVEKVAPGRDSVAVTLRADAKVKPGLKGNLILEAYVERQVNAKQAQRRKQPLGTLPAVPFEVVK
jgi:hypothetical protein